MTSVFYLIQVKIETDTTTRYAEGVSQAVQPNMRVMPKTKYAI